jgi:type VI secretion system secreted protein VgrG
MAWTEPAGESKFLFKILGGSFETLVADFNLNERISVPFDLNVTLACEEEIKFDDAISKEALMTILGEDEDRHIHGVISEFMHTGSKGKFYVYQARVVPSVWFLLLEQDCRIFQNKSVQEIIVQILKDAGISSDRYDFRLQGQYQPREYCVQYRESDLNFISRLLEEEGIFYFFEHTEDKHIIVFADSTVAYQQIKGDMGVTFNPSEGMVPEEECVYGFAFSRRILSGKITQRDFNFEKPSLDLTASDQAKSNQKLELYDYPGEYLDQDRGKKLVQVRLQETRMYTDKAEGKSVCPRLVPGFKFKLTDHERQDFNQEYLVVEVLHSGSHPQVFQEQAGIGEKASYSNNFMGIPAAVISRPERKTPRPVVKGVQTAIVVGPKGEEIYTDEHGRVKVQFHWDREGKNDEKSSCWIRVSQVWAGASWGAMYIPRIGHEVVVDFIEGDPDRPIITGRVYHGTNMPPYTLPDEKTKSTIKSDSSLGGGGFNEIRFEDKKGSEEIFVQAEKDMNTLIKANETREVGADRTTHVKGHFKETIDSGEDRTVHAAFKETIDGGETRTVDGGVTETINGGETRTVNGGQTETINGGQTETINGGQTETINGGETRTVNGAQTETVNGAVIQNVSGGVTINSPGGYTIVAPGGTRTVDAFFDSLGKLWSQTFGTHQQVIMNNQSLIGGLNLDQKNVSIEITTLKLEDVYTNYALKPLDMSTVGISIKNKSLDLDWGFHIIS